MKDQKELKSILISRLHVYTVQLQSPKASVVSSLPLVANSLLMKEIAQGWSILLKGTRSCPALWLEMVASCQSLKEPRAKPPLSLPCPHSHICSDLYHLNGQKTLPLTTYVFSNTKSLQPNVVKPEVTGISDYNKYRAARFSSEGSRRLS